jgi:hypothetical protein
MCIDITQVDLYVVCCNLYLVKCMYAILENG